MPVQGTPAPRLGKRVTRSVSKPANPAAEPAAEPMPSLSKPASASDAVADPAGAGVSVSKPATGQRRTYGGSDAVAERDDPYAIRGGRPGQYQKEHHAEIVRQMGGPSNYLTDAWGWSSDPRAPLAAVDDIASGRIRNSGMIATEARIIAENDTERDIWNAGMLTQNLKYARIPMGKQMGTALEDTREVGIIGSDKRRPWHDARTHDQEFNKYRFAQIWMNDQMKRLLKTSASPEDVYGQMKILGFGALAEDPDGMFSEEALLDFAATAAKDVSDWKQHTRGLTKRIDPKTGDDIWEDKRTESTNPARLNRMEGESRVEWGLRLTAMRGQGLGRPGIYDPLRPGEIDPNYPIMGHPLAPFSGAGAGVPQRKREPVRHEGPWLSRRKGESLAEFGARITPSTDQSGGLF